MALDSDSNMTLAGVAVVAAIISGIGLFVSYKKMINFRRKTCDSCHESLDGCAWEYQETSSKFENGREKVSFQIRVKCPHCGRTKTFTETFSVAPGDNVQYLIDNYMRNQYGDRM